MSTTNVYMVASLLEKMSNDDRDFRYMALNDLMNELQKDSFRLEPVIEGKVVRSVLRLLDDKNGEVQNLAVKCLGPLVKQITTENTLEIVDFLSESAEQQKNEVLRSITSMGLKTVITEVNPSRGDQICARIIPRLLSMIDDEGAPYEMQMDTLDILAEVLSRFGSQLSDAQQKQIQNSLLPLLGHSRAAVRKRTTTAIGYLVIHTDDELFTNLLSYLVQQLQQKNRSSEKLRTLVQCTGVLSRYSAVRLGKYIPDIIPVIFSYISEAEDDDELREICLQSLESFVLRCPAEMSPFIHNVIEIGLEYLKHDPNFAGDDDEEEDDIMDEEEDEFEDDDIDYSDDDDDMSWKVRRSATKLLAAVIETRFDLLQQLYEVVAPALITRFREREDSVRADILQTFIVLLRQTDMYGARDILDVTKSGFTFDTTSFGEELAILPTVATKNHSLASNDNDANSPRELLRAQVPKLCRTLAKQLSSKSTQTRQIGFRLLRDLISVLDGGLDQEIGLFMPAIESSLASGATEQQQLTLTSNLKIEVLTFLRKMLHNHQPNVLEPYLQHLCPAVIQTISDRFYKITSEAFLVCIELIKAIRPIAYDADNASYTVGEMKEKYRAYILDIYNATTKVLGTNDADQEVKERSIMCLGSLLFQLGDILQEQQQQAWSILLDRIRNEVTRLIAVRTLAITCQSPVAAGPELERCVLIAVDEIAPLLRKNSRALRIACTECLRIIVARFGDKISNASIDNLLAELKPLINDSDLHILPLALRTIEAVVTVSPQSAEKTKSCILPALFQLIQSPLLQGTSLNSLLSLFAALGKADPADYQTLVNALVDPLLSVQTTGVSAGGVAAVANKQAAATVAQCVAVLAVNTDEHQYQNTIQGFQSYIKDATTNDSVKYLSLLTIGEIGRRADLITVGDLVDQILELFSAQSEEVKFAAAFALGNISVGNLDKYLPLMISQIKEQPKRRYLLLHALKEIITRSEVNSKLGEASSEIWSLLIESSELEQEEGTRSVVAECLGKLTLTDRRRFLPELQTRLTSPSAHVRATVVTAIKYAVVDPTQSYDDLLKPIVSQFLMLLHDPDLNVRRLALLTMNSAVHRKSYLVRDIMNQIVPLLYEETVVRSELIHTVEMGPFKHKVDDGLEIRKAAYECMYTLLTTCLDKIDIQGFLDRVEAGLDDQHDIKMLAYLMLARLSRVAQTAVAQRLDDFVAPFRSTLDFKMRTNAVKQEVEKNQELVRGTLRCILALKPLSDPEVSPKFDAFFHEVKTGGLKEDYKKAVMEADSRTTRSADYMDLS